MTDKAQALSCPIIHDFTANLSNSGPWKIQSTLINSALPNLSRKKNCLAARSQRPDHFSPPNTKENNSLGTARGWVQVTTTHFPLQTQHTYHVRLAGPVVREQAILTFFTATIHVVSTRVHKIYLAHNTKPSVVISLAHLHNSGYFSIA